MPEPTGISEIFLLAVSLFEAARKDDRPLNAYPEPWTYYFDGWLVAINGTKHVVTFDSGNGVIEFGPLEVVIFNSDLFGTAIVCDMQQGVAVGDSEQQAIKALREEIKLLGGRLPEEINA